MSNTAIIQASYAAFHRGDLDAALAAFAPDVEWSHPEGMSDYGLGGTKKGLAEVRAFMARARTVFSEIRPDPHEFVESGGRVIVLGNHHMRGHHSGVAGTVPFVHSWQLVDGKATHFDDFHDTAAVRAIVEGQQAGQSRHMALHDGYIHWFAMQLTAELGIAEQLAEGPRSADELAVASGTHPRALHRMLRTLTSSGAFTEVEPGRFGLTDFGALLRPDHPQSMHGIMVMGTLFAKAFADAMYSLRTGEPSFPHTYGVPLFAYLQQHPEQGALFTTAMAEFSRREIPAILETYDFSGAKRVVDVGGGDGTLLGAVLRANPDVSGVLFDQPQVVAGAAELGAEAGWEVVSGDFFKGVPVGGDMYVLKSIIHDWPDESAITILRNCREAIAPEGRLVLIERVVPPGDAPHPSKVMDFTMLVVLGGQERTRDEYSALLARAGFRLVKVLETSLGMSVMEAVPV